MLSQCFVVFKVDDANIVDVLRCLGVNQIEIDKLEKCKRTMNVTTLAKFEINNTSHLRRITGHGIPSHLAQMIIKESKKIWNQGEELIVL